MNYSLTFACSLFLVSCAQVDLCDGSQNVRFAAQYGGTGTVKYGSQLLYENGLYFLAIDGQCRYWSQNSLFREVYTGVLTKEQANDVANRLRLSSWGLYVGHYQTGWCDGPWARFRLDSEVISLGSACNGLHSSGGIQWLRDEFMSINNEFVLSGSPAETPARFTLVAATDQLISWPPYRNAPLWSLSAPIADLALTPEEATEYEYLPVSERSHVFDADEARVLWEYAAMYRRGEIGVDYAQLIPLRDADDNLYELFLRGTVPFEDENGRWQ